MVSSPIPISRVNRTQLWISAATVQSPLANNARAQRKRTVANTTMEKARRAPKSFAKQSSSLSNESESSKILNTYRPPLASSTHIFIRVQILLLLPLVLLRALICLHHILLSLLQNRPPILLPDHGPTSRACHHHPRHLSLQICSSKTPRRNSSLPWNSHRCCTWITSCIDPFVAHGV